MGVELELFSLVPDRPIEGVQVVCDSVLGNLRSLLLTNTHTMNSQQPGMNVNPGAQGGGGAYVAQPKPDMEYICAGECKLQPVNNQDVYFR